MSGADFPGDMETNLRPRMVDDPGIWFGIATGLVLVALLAGGLAGLGSFATALLALAVAAAAAIRLPVAPAVALGAVLWAFFTGFDVNTFGQLTFGADDLARLATFALATATFSFVARRAVRHG